MALRFSGNGEGAIRLPPDVEDGESQPNPVPGFVVPSPGADHKSPNNATDGAVALGAHTEQASRTMNMDARRRPRSRFKVNADLMPKQDSLMSKHSLCTVMGDDGCCCGCSWYFPCLFFFQCKCNRRYRHRDDDDDDDNNGGGDEDDHNNDEP